MTADLRHQVSKPISRMAKTGALGPAEVCAARAIEEAVISILSQDVRSGKFERINLENGGRGSCFEDAFIRRHDLRQNYYQWVEEMTARKVPAGPVLDVIIEGRALTEVDRAWKKRKGWTRQKLVDGLRLFNEVRSSEQEKRNRLTA